MLPRHFNLIIVLYFFILLGLAPINLLSLDTYYYWDWSRHLDLSYYDGPPVIAYAIRLSTLLFGNTLFALSFVGIVVAALTSWIIYKTARLFLSRESSYIAMFSWLFAPLVTEDILKQTTYDTPLTLFWALTLYYTVRYIQTNKIKELYFIGASAGFMMLSKYTGIVLILSLLIFLVCTSYRSIFKIKHFYYAIFLTIIIFSPVLFWNYQNHWQSFIYQFTVHQLSDLVNPFYNIIKTFCTLFIFSLNIMLIPPLWLICTKLNKKNELIVKLCYTICIFFLIFYLYLASKAEIRAFWLSPYLISSGLLFGYCYELFPYRRLAILSIAIFGLISICIILDNTFKYNFINSKKLVFYYLIQQLNATHSKPPDSVLTSGWFQARMLFFLENKPAIYTLGCGTAQNQYALWSTDINKKIANKTLKEVLYIDKYDRKNCLDKYFDQCQKIPTNTRFFKHKEYALNVYRCRNF